MLLLIIIAVLTFMRMKKVSLEQALMMLVLGLTGCCIGLIICFAAEHKQRVQYEQAARVLNQIRKEALDDENLDYISFEELQGDMIGNMDCHGLCIDQRFIYNLKEAY